MRRAPFDGSWARGSWFASLDHVLAVFLLFVGVLSANAQRAVQGELFAGNGVSDLHGRLERNSIGIQGLKKLSNAGGDWATLALQARLVHYVNLDMDNRAFARTREWEPEIHTAYVNFKGFFGRLNLKLGHLEIPFGLEPVTDTHSVLVPSTAMTNLGTMQDWGVSLNGQLAPFDYEISATTGAGMNAVWNPLEYESGMFLAAARIQPVLSGNTQIGISALVGEMDPMMHEPEMHGHDAERDAFRSERRVGFDVRATTFLRGVALNGQGELAAGTRDGANVLSFDGSISHDWDSGFRLLVGLRLWKEGENTDTWTLASLRREVTASFAWEIMAQRDLSGMAKDTSLLTLVYWTL